MKKLTLAAVLVLLPLAAQERTAETWQAGYTGADADGPQVLGYWRFDAGAVTDDTSGKGNSLTLSGAAPAAQGKFGGALESFPGWPVADKRHAAFANSKPALSPRGAFSLEMWIKPKPELAAELQPVLVDKKYVAHTDYQWRLTAADKGGARRMQVILGFGDESEVFHSEPFALGTNWQHVAFTYDAAGEVRFFRNGAPLGAARKPGRGPIAPGRQIFSIGDRVGSNYAGFPGFIDDVRLCAGVLEFRPLAVGFRAGRRTWRRLEQAPPVAVTVRNLSRAATAPLKLRVSVEGLAEARYVVPALAAGATHEVAYPFDTTLRPDTYRLKARVETTGEPAFASEESIEFVIAPRPPAGRMPVMMWGINSPENIAKELPRLKDLGFTHCLGGGADMGSIWEAGKPVPPAKEDRIAATKAMLDLALANDFGIAFSLSVGHWLAQRPELRRLDRNGKPYAPRSDVNAALPGLADFGFNVGASVAQTYREFPAWQATLIDTEVRDGTQLSFSKFDREAYRKFSGREIPAEAANKRGADWKKLAGFPADRIVPDDLPVLQYLRWFWTVGDGWNALHTAVHRGIHSTGRDDVWTWFDPAIRVPSVGGSGGDVDVLGQWTYTNPDPVRIGYFADELLAMAANSPRRPRVMKMTQLFWYRAQSAPKKAGAEHVASPFDDHDPDAAYITIAPLHLRESFWTKLARPVDGIMYHGWQALVPTESTSGYRYTNPDTKEEFRRLHRGVLEPLGPTLRQVGDRRCEVAFLDSFTSQMLAGRGSYGYSGDEAYLTLLYAQLQPEVFFEETVRARGLEGFRVLVLTDCDVLPVSVAQRIREFQQRGGIVVGDENLAPGIKPEIVLPKITRQKKGDVDHAALLANAAKLRVALDGRFPRYADSTNPEVVTRVRSAGASDYVFVVNDRREFGTYVGQHGLVMENGLPSEARLTLRRPAGSVYDLVAGRAVKATARNGQLSWAASLGPGEGGVFLITPRPIGSVTIAAVDSAPRGSEIDVAVDVIDEAGAKVAAVVPVRVEIADAAGRSAEYSGYYGAQDGAVRLRLNLAANDTPGVWQIRVRELASGLTATHYLRVAAGKVAGR